MSANEHLLDLLRTEFEGVDSDVIQRFAELAAGDPASVTEIFKRHYKDKVRTLRADALERVQGSEEKARVVAVMGRARELASQSANFILSAGDLSKAADGLDRILENERLLLEGLCRLIEHRTELAGVESDPAEEEGDA